MSVFKHEMDEAPGKTEAMRRGKLKARAEKGNYADFAEDVDERVRRALMYHQVWKWTQELAYTFAGIGRDKFKNALKAGGAGIVRTGRKPILSDELAELVAVKITELSITYKSLRKEGDEQGTVMGLIREMIQERQHNATVAPPPFDDHLCPFPAGC